MKNVQYYCKACGAALGDTNGLTHCLECHTKIGNGRSFCGQCGLNRAQNMCYSICPTCQASFEEQDKQISDDVPLSTPSSTLSTLDFTATTVKQNSSSIINTSNQSIVSSNKTSFPSTKIRKIKLAGFLTFAGLLSIACFFLGYHLGKNNDKIQPEIADNPVADAPPKPEDPLDKDEPIIQDEPKEAEQQEQPEVIDPQEQPNEIYLDEMTLSEAIGLSTDDMPTDVTGKQYFNHYITLTDYGFQDGHIKVYLGKKYTQLSGIIAIDLDTTNEDLGVITIKNDGNVLYSTGKIPKSTSPIELSQLDISGCEWLTFDVDLKGQYLNSKFSIILSDFKLS